MITFARAEAPVYALIILAGILLKLRETGIAGFASYAHLSSYGD